MIDAMYFLIISGLVLYLSIAICVGFSISTHYDKLTFWSIFLIVIMALIWPISLFLRSFAQWLLEGIE